MARRDGHLFRLPDAGYDLVTIAVTIRLRLGQNDWSRVKVG